VPNDGHKPIEEPILLASFNATIVVVGAKLEFNEDLVL
jgi:hypothetical protein